MNFVQVAQLAKINGTFGGIIIFRQIAQLLKQKAENHAAVQTQKNPASVLSEVFRSKMQDLSFILFQKLYHSQLCHLQLCNLQLCD